MFKASSNLESSAGNDDGGAILKTAGTNVSSNTERSGSVEGNTAGESLLDIDGYEMLV